MRNSTFIALATAAAIATATPTTASVTDRDIILQGEQVVMEVQEDPVSKQTEVPSPNPSDNKAKEKPKPPDVSDVIERGLSGETLHREDWVALAQLPDAGDVIKRGLNGETLHLEDWLSLALMLLMGFVL